MYPVLEDYRPALQSEAVGSQWTQYQSSTGLHTDGQCWEEGGRCIIGT